MQRIELAPTITLNVAETEKFKTGYLSVNFMMPLAKPDCALGALLTAVLRRSSKAYQKAIDVARALEKLYGASVSRVVRKKGDSAVLGLSISFLDDRFSLEGETLRADAARFLAELLLRPDVTDCSFDEEIVKQEKRNLCDLIESRINDKRSYAVTRCVEIMCEGEPYGLSELGTVEEVKAITAKELYGFYRRMLTSFPIEIFYIGAAAPELPALLKEEFGKLSHEQVVELSNQMKPADKEVKKITEEMPVAQGKLTIGFRTGIVAGDEDFPALVLFNAIYGRTPGGKLFEHVRERLSLCYYCSTQLSKNKGILLVSSGVESENKEKAETEILAQWKAIKEGDFTEDELKESVIALRNAYRSAEDSASAIEDWYLTNLTGNGEYSLSGMSELIGKVSREDVIRVARQMTLDTVYFLKGTAR